MFLFNLNLKDQKLSKSNWNMRETEMIGVVRTILILAVHIKLTEKLIQHKFLDTMGWTQSTNTLEEWEK